MFKYKWNRISKGVNRMRRNIKVLTEKAIELLNDRKVIEDELKKEDKATCYVETEAYKLSIKINKKENN